MSKTKQALKNGTKCIFSLEDITESEFEECEILNAGKYEGKECKVVCLQMSNAGDESDKDYEYYDIIFLDDTEMPAISGYHLTKK